MKNTIYFLEFIFIWLLDGFFRLWPRSLAIYFGERVGLLMSFVLPSRRRLVVANLQAAFSEKSPQEISMMAREFWRNVGRIAIEFIRLSDLNKRNFNDFFSIEGGEYYEAARALGKGVILVGFHFSNWEYSGVGIQYFFGDVVAIARPIKNPWVQKWVLKKRRAGNLDIILHRQAVKESLRALRQKKSVGILVDQNLYTGGEFIKFFGRSAASTTLPALLESRTGSPVMLLYVLRDQNKFKLVFEKPIHFPETKNPNWLQERTQIVSDHVEAAIRKRPEHWFWIHNRWKRSPPADNSPVA